MIITDWLSLVTVWLKICSFDERIKNVTCTTTYIWLESALHSIFSAEGLKIRFKDCAHICSILTFCQNPLRYVLTVSSQNFGKSSTHQKSPLWVMDFQSGPTLTFTKTLISPQLIRGWWYNSTYRFSYRSIFALASTKHRCQRFKCENKKFTKWKFIFYELLVMLSEEEKSQKDRILTASKTIWMLTSWHKSLVPALGS